MFGFSVPVLSTPAHGLVGWWVRCNQVKKMSVRTPNQPPTEQETEQIETETKKIMVKDEDT